MNKTTTPYLNKQIRRREEERNRCYHLEHLKQMRPLTSGIQQPEHYVINNRKREQIMENRFTEIQRENRILLQKISGIMGHRPRDRKRGQSTFVNSKDVPKSLNVTFRKRQYQEIEIENAKLLKRLQEKKSEYQTDKMKKDWRKQRHIIRNISNHPLGTLDKKPRDRSETGLSTMQKVNKQRASGSAEANIEVCRLKNITGYSFMVSVRLDATKMTIIAHPQKKDANSEAKTIEIPREQAMVFIAEQCNDRIEDLFDMLYFDGDTLFLIGQSDEQDYNHGNREDCNEQQKHQLKKPIGKQSFSEQPTPQQEIKKHDTFSQKKELQEKQYQSDIVEHATHQNSAHPEAEAVQAYAQENIGEPMGELTINHQSTPKTTQDINNKYEHNAQLALQVVHPNDEAKPF